MDWSLGSYEHTAAQLLPAARVVVEQAAPTAGEHVVDVGCGTGNAALLAAARGARVTGVDPAARLREVAAASAAARGLDAAFVDGEAAAIPLPDGSADVVLSVFGVIFAPDAPAAIAEMARITAPDGRIVLSTWIPEGTIAAAVRVGREALAAAAPAPSSPPPPPFPWHEQEALAAAFAPHGFAVDLRDEQLAFTGDSPQAYADREFANHPMWATGKAVLEPRGELERVREQTIAALTAGNEDPDAFRATSRYVVVTARRE